MSKREREMSNPKVTFVALLFWGATAVCAFWVGLRWTEKGDGDRVDTPPAAAVAAAPLPQPRIEELPAPAVPSKEEGRPAPAIVAEAVDLLRGGMMSQRRVLGAFGLMQELDEASVLDALAEVESMDAGRSDREFLLLAVVGRWAELDGAAAMRYAEEQLEGDLRAGVMTNAAAAWAETDPAKALAWYRAREADGTLGSTIGSAATTLLAPIFQELANRDPEAAMSELLSLGGGAEFSSALAGLVSALSAAGKSTGPE